jgi:hypothetical protein
MLMKRSGERKLAAGECWASFETYQELSSSLILTLSPKSMVSNGSISNQSESVSTHGEDWRRNNTYLMKITSLSYLNTINP